MLHKRVFLWAYLVIAFTFVLSTWSTGRGSLWQTKKRGLRRGSGSKKGGGLRHGSGSRKGLVLGRGQDKKGGLYRGTYPYWIYANVDNRDNYTNSLITYTRLPNSYNKPHHKYTMMSLWQLQIASPVVTVGNRGYTFIVRSVIALLLLILCYTWVTSYINMNIILRSITWSNGFHQFYACRCYWSSKMSNVSLIIR